MIELPESRYHVPASIENDALKDEEFGLVIVVGTGIGSALVYKGEILRGSHNYAGGTLYDALRQRTGFRFQLSVR